MRCYYCGRPAKRRCPTCGRPLCERHDCYACSRGKCEICGKELAIGRCYYCGRLICRNCSVELSPGIRACKECYSKRDYLERNNDQLELYERWVEGKVRRLTLLLYRLE
ncbi:hypothetical protein [Ignicoccus islandicus]|uniref:hypothetical protein n=1 Tax=Ignicoccus islandicus TaxID=54259 RepID=UPI00157B8B57|nr:hypothetical protein [Ignicoccus islandicus]